LSKIRLNDRRTDTNGRNLQAEGSLCNWQNWQSTTGIGRVPGDALENAIRKNVEIGVERLKRRQPILAPRVKGGKLKVMGLYSDCARGE
jgi:hypothetical protein